MQILMQILRRTLDMTECRADNYAAVKKSIIIYVIEYLMRQNVAIRK